MRSDTRKNEWQTISGAGDARVMPLLSSAVTAGGNVYLVDYQELFLLVGLGADPGRVTEIVDAVNAVDPSQAKPLLVVLTHCHVDHIAAAPELERLRPRPFSIAGHVAGAPVLAAQDETLTMSFLFRCVSPRINVGLTFFGDGSCPEARGATHFRLGNTLLTLSPSDQPSGFQNVAVKERVIASVYATPGHSPDSICLLIGDILFCGDLPFAGNPAVMGIPGWNRGHLLTSLETIIGLLEDSDGATVCCGHGPVWNRDTALAQFATARRLASAANGIATLDVERAAFLKRYARALLREAKSTFAIMAGRLLLVAEQLELLEETERSRAIRESRTLAALDELVEQLERSAGREDRPGEPATRAPMVSGAILAKIDTMLGDAFFTDILDAARLRRARNLIVDFQNALQGISFRQLLRSERPEHLVQYLLDAPDSRPCKDSELMAAAGDHDRFVSELMRRLASRSLFSNVTFCATPSEELPFVAVERGHPIDTLVGLCELLVVSGGKRIAIALDAAGPDVRLVPSTEIGMHANLVTAAKVEFYTDTLRLYGAAFAVQHEEERLALEICFPSAEAFDDSVM